MEKKTFWAEEDWIGVEMNTINKLKYLMDKRMKIKTVINLILIMIGAAAELLGVAAILPIINLAVDVNYEEDKICKIVMRLTGYQEREQIMLVVIAATIVIYIAKSMYLSWMYSRLYKFSAEIKKDMAVKLMRSYLIQPYAFFLKKNTSELIRSVNSDTAQLYEIVLNCLLFFSNALTAVVLMITLLVTNVAMTLTVVVLLAACAITIFLVVQKRTRYYGKRNQDLSAFLIKYLQQIFEGVKEIKILNTEKYFMEKYSKVYEEQANNMRKYSLCNLIPKYMIELVCIIGIMSYLAFNIMYNQNYMELIPQLGVFVMAAYKLLPAVNAAYAYLNTIVYHRASIDLVYHDVKEADDLEAKELFDSKNKIVKKFEKEICLNDIVFQYENAEKPVLNHVNLEIPKGKSVALIGPSGGGKTTTVDIILGLLKPTNGEVLVDGENIAECLENWRAKIGYIPQNIYLTDGSIKSNIALGVPKEEIVEEQVWKALEEAQLADFVRTLPEGLDTEVGERGARISGGQRQRIGIARALYHSPEVLVFDEATSALDNETEKEVMKAIDSLHGNKTMIMIAHRLTTIENCDMVYKVEKAQIVRER